MAAGVLTTAPTAPLPTRLAELQAGLRALIVELEPQAVAVERVFFSANARTAMAVGQASGLALAEAAAAGCDVAQYTPNEVKVAVTGAGAAPKEQVHPHGPVAPVPARRRRGRPMPPTPWRWPCATTPAPRLARRVAGATR